MPYARNRIPAIHSVASILTGTHSFISLIKPIDRHQATSFSRALKETRARLANKEEHENKKTLSMNPVDQKEAADKAFFRYPEKKGTALVLNISCDKALEGRKMFEHVTLNLSTVMIVLHITHCSFISQNLDIDFPKVLICTTMSSFKRMRKVAKRYY